jgi:hypothetical protein
MFAKTNRVIFVLGALLSSYAASASVLTITCGQNAYEALEKGKPEAAEFALVLKLRGPGMPAQMTSFQDDFMAVDEIESLETRVGGDGEVQIKIGLPGFHRYEIRVRDCADIDSASGQVTQFRNGGGFAGVQPVAKAQCSCLKR